MNKNLLNIALISLLSASIIGCGNKNNSPDQTSTPVNNSTGDKVETSTPTEQLSTEEKSIDPWASTDDDRSYLSISQEEEPLGLIPEEVLNANVDIDFLIYIVGQDNVMNDIGNYCWDETDPNYDQYRYHPKDVSSVEMARWVAAAQAFKKLAPGVKINLKYCTSDDYNNRVEAYQQAYGHLPELMWTTDRIIDVATKGWATDLSRYSDSEYYEQYSEFLLSRYNLGGFQAGLPMSTNPWGMFVNQDILTDPSNPIVMSVIENGQNSQEYIDWVDNFTWQAYVDAAKKAYSPEHAGVSQMNPWVLSYSLQTIYDQYIAEGTVDLTSQETLSKVKKLLELENELSQYSVYPYNEEKTMTSVRYFVAKDEYKEAHNWSAVKNFTQDQYSLFASEAPWAVSSWATNAKTLKEGNVDCIKNMDFLPFPKVDDDSPLVSSVGVGGLVVGEQCPIEDGVEKCFEKDSKLKMDIAAYFIMFASLDPRAVKAKSQVQYYRENVGILTGDLDFPLCKRGTKFSWQSDPEKLALFEDPAADFDDNWQYQLYNWLANHPMYLTNDEEPDVENFTNIKYGLYKHLDSLYMLEGDTINSIAYNVEPISFELNGEIQGIFDEWDDRYSHYAEQNDDGSYSGCLGTQSYVATILDKLSSIEDRINKNAKSVWSYIKESLADYYYDENGDPLYPYADDRTYRTTYEGSRFN